MIFVPREVRILVVLEILCCISHFIGLVLNTRGSVLENECVRDSVVDCHRPSVKPNLHVGSLALPLYGMICSLLISRLFFTLFFCIFSLLSTTPYEFSSAPIILTASSWAAICPALTFLQTRRYDPFPTHLVSA
jgi:hypothetical protein